MGRKRTADHLVGSWVGAQAGVTNDMLAEAGVQDVDIKALRMARLIATSPAQDAPLTFGEAAESVRQLWNPRTEHVLRLPEAWLARRTVPLDYDKERVIPPRTAFP